MPNNQRSKCKISTTKNINWLVKQYVLAIPLVRLMYRIDVKICITTFSNQADTYHETYYFLCRSFKYITNGKPATNPILRLASFSVSSQ